MQQLITFFLMTNRFKVQSKLTGYGKLGSGMPSKYNEIKNMLGYKRGTMKSSLKIILIKIKCYITRCIDGDKTINIKIM